ncbi:Rha family transcriptional regulator [Methylobacterium radiotolerans]|uniref:Rha family transcriptional regulator n=1 Tax=Methylobacterium radiotolerans TaxID=31998 RepID=UPI0005E66083|nr:Rha family transcriptional regulator [Methylobacterium radiotolerans]GAN50946.1 hypothetical protein ME121_5005 [Methylobacterium sp. ME121]
MAEVTGKRHADVLQDVDTLLQKLAMTGRPNLDHLMFQEVTAFDPAANRDVRSFEMTWDGMALLVMGYTLEELHEHMRKAVLEAPQAAI